MVVANILGCCGVVVVRILRYRWVGLLVTWRSRKNPRRLPGVIVLALVVFEGVNVVIGVVVVVVVAVVIVVVVVVVVVAVLDNVFVFVVQFFHAWVIVKFIQRIPMTFATLLFENGSFRARFLHMVFFGWFRSHWLDNRRTRGFRWLRGHWLDNRRTRGFGWIRSH